MADDLLKAIALFLAAQCPLCHGLGIYTAGFGPKGEVVQKPCYRCQGLRDG